MKTQKLIPLLDYVLEQTNHHFDKCYVDQDSANTDLIDRIHNYAKFLSQPLKLSQFVPCDEKGNFLEEPKREFFSTNFDFKEEMYLFNEAKSDVLFEGFEIEDVDKFGYILKRGEIFIDLGEVMPRLRNI